MTTQITNATDAFGKASLLEHDSSPPSWHRNVAPDDLVLALCLPYRIRSNEGVSWLKQHRILALSAESTYMPAAAGTQMLAPNGRKMLQGVFFH